MTNGAGQMTTPKTDDIPCFPSEADITKRLSSRYIYVVCIVPAAFKNMHQMNDALLFLFLNLITIALLTLMGHLLNLTMTTTKVGAVKYKSMSLRFLTHKK